MKNYKVTLVLSIAFIILISGITGLLVFFPNSNNIEKARQACVLVTDGWGHGSGVHIGDGIILTAAHVACIDNIWVEDFEGRTYTVIDQWIDPFWEDVGFIRIRRKDLPKLEFGLFPKVGDTAYVIGTPLDQNIKLNFTKGIVSNVHVDIDGWWYDALIVDAASFPGNSGGPVLNENFEIIGILVGGYGSFDSLSICEPLNDILDVLVLYLGKE